MVALAVFLVLISVYGVNSTVTPINKMPGGVTERALSSHPDCSNLIRLFHPAFPLEILEVCSLDEAERLESLRGKVVKANLNYGKLPWRMMPALGISKGQNVWSNNEVINNFDKVKHESSMIWAHKLDKPEVGCLLLNHWKQNVVKLTSYDPQRGARGVEIGASGNEQRSLVWPPLALEIELQERHWQLCAVSPNLLTDVFPQLPQEMEKAPWEIIFLLLLSMDNNNNVHKEEVQALFDTGISPRQGFIAYLRLLRQVLSRTKVFDGVDDYRKIIEKEITL